MASTNADTNSVMNNARAAWSILMAHSFRAVRSAVASVSAPDRRAQPVADTGEHDDVGGQYHPPQRGHFLLQSRALLGGLRRLPRTQAAPDQRDQRTINQSRDHRTDDRTEKPGRGQIDHA